MSIMETNFYKGEQGPQGPQGPEGPEGPAGGQDVQHDDTLSGNGSPENPLKSLPSSAICEMTVNDVGAAGYNKFVNALQDGKLICYWDNTVGWLICSDYDITIPSGFAFFTGVYRTSGNNDVRVAEIMVLFSSPGVATWGNVIIRESLTVFELGYVATTENTVVASLKKSNGYNYLSFEFTVLDQYLLNNVSTPVQKVYVQMMQKDGTDFAASYSVLGHVPNSVSVYTYSDGDNYYIGVTRTGFFGRTKMVLTGHASPTENYEFGVISHAKPSSSQTLSPIIL